MPTVATKSVEVHIPKFRTGTSKLRACYPTGREGYYVYEEENQIEASRKNLKEKMFSKLAVRAEGDSARILRRRRNIFGTKVHIFLLCYC